MAHSGNYVFLAHETGLLSYDVTDPARLVILDEIDLQASRVEASVSEVYAIANGGVVSINASDPSNMYIEGFVGLLDPQDAVPTPDPFRSRTSLRFRLAEPSDAGLSVYDPGGRKLRTLLRSGLFPAGAHSLDWDGRDEQGREMPAGVYFARLAVNGRSFTTRLVRIR